MKQTVLFLGFLLPLLLSLGTACYRQGSLNTAVSFQGVVNSGHSGKDSQGNTTLIVDGPQQNATVTCEGYPEKATTAADGSYSLTVHAVRKFNNPYADSFTITANNAQGASEKIAVSGNPGDIVQVRSFVLHKHPEE